MLLIVIVDAFSEKANGDQPCRFPLRLSLQEWLACIYHWQVKTNAFAGMIIFDSFSLTASFIFCLAALINDSCWYMKHSVRIATISFPADPDAFGMIFLAAGSHFVVIFIGLEILSLSVYVLAAFAKKDPLSAESGLKYFLLGSFASAFFLYGVAFVYGASGSLQLNGIAKALSAAGFDNQTCFILD